MNIRKYENSWGKWLYSGSGSFSDCGYREVQLHEYPFHTGLRILVTNGHKYFKDIHCKNIFEAKREFRKYQELIKHGHDFNK